MRMIGQVAGEANARRFSDFLLSQGIENQLEAEAGGAWMVWIHAEEELQRARELLARFQANPADGRFDGSERAAREARERKQKEQEAFEQRVRGRQQLFRTLTPYGFGPLTFVLICLCVVLFLMQQFLLDPSAILKLHISEQVLAGNPIDRLVFGLQEVKHGEVWRLVTPILLHGDALHIFFNMWWLMDLGSMIEGRQGTGVFAAQVLVFAVVSNLAQYAMVGPMFLGMSGVVYGLFGYIWIRGRLEPGSGLYLHQSTVTMMLVWMGLGFAGFMRMANWAHLGGLVAGVAWGYLSSWRYRRG